jgi:site-specific DNA-methyltransferase (adenine-specific)
MEIDNIYNMDCLEGMKQIPDGTIDAVICDLPYGTTRNQWDSVIPLDKLWAEYRRIIKERGAIVLFSQQPFTSALVMSNPKMFRYEGIWEKEMGTGFLNANYAPLKSHENVLVFSSLAACYVKNPADAMVYHPQMTEGKAYTCKQGKMEHNYDTKNMVAAIETKNDGKRYPKTILRYNRDKDKIHPTQKPVELYSWILKRFAHEGDKIFDPMMSSQSSRIAAYMMGFDYVGCEIDEEYFSKGCERFNRECKGEFTLPDGKVVKQPTLFD